MSEIHDPLPVPKPKRVVPNSKGVFFPLDFSRRDSACSPGVIWRHFTGALCGDWVTVTNSAAAVELSAANFGKGAWSRFGRTLDDDQWRPWIGEEEEEKIEEEEEDRAITSIEMSVASSKTKDNRPPREDPPVRFRRQIPRRRFDAHRKWRAAVERRKESEPLPGDRADERLAKRRRADVADSNALYVTEDSDEDERIGGRLHVVADDPLPLKEPYLLSHEEAFFLSYGLGCLTVTDSGAPLTLVSLWRRLRLRDTRFVPRYVAYHAFRSRGWVPRCGLKYGVDFLLYVRGPAFYHATFSVVVEEVDEDLKKIESPVALPSTAAAATACLRVTDQVNKDLLVCRVVRGRDVDEKLLSTPRCVAAYRIKQTLKRRWVTDTERDRTKRIVAPSKISL